MQILKNSVDPIFLKTKKQLFFLCKKKISTEFF